MSIEYCVVCSILYDMCSMYNEIFIMYLALYHGLASFTWVPFVNVHPVQMSTFVCLWCIGFVTVRTTKINRKYRLWYNVSVPYPKPGLAENTGNVELGAAPLVQHFSVFSARPGLGYGTDTLYLLCLSKQTFKDISKLRCI